MQKLCSIYVVVDDDDDDNNNNNNNNNNNHIKNYKETTMYYFRLCPRKPVARCYKSRALLGRIWL